MGSSANSLTGASGLCISALTGAIVLAVRLITGAVVASPDAVSSFAAPAIIGSLAISDRFVTTIGRLDADGAVFPGLATSVILVLLGGIFLVLVFAGFFFKLLSGADTPHRR
jgi:hypothetical protein